MYIAEMYPSARKYQAMALATRKAKQEGWIAPKQREEIAERGSNLGSTQGCLCWKKKITYFVETDHRSLLENIFNDEEDVVVDDLSDEKVEFLLHLGLVEGIGVNFKHKPNENELCKTLHGSGGLRINNERRMTMSGVELFQERYAAISYKHMHWKKDEAALRDSTGARDILMPDVEGRDVLFSMCVLEIPYFWHDGTEKRHGNGNPSCANGLYPYLLDGNFVLVVPPTCRREAVPDPTTWVSQVR